MFKNVFEIVAPRIFGNISWMYGRASWDTKDTEVETLIFNCRLVCGTWNSFHCDLAEERFGYTPNQNRFMQVGYWNIRKIYAVFQFINRTYKFDRSDKIENFTKKFKNSASNPFFGETVFLTLFGTDFNIDRFHDKIVTFANLFGR